MKSDEERNLRRDETKGDNCACEHVESPAAFPGKLSGLSPRALRLVVILASGLGIGYSPVLPGTLGTVLGVGIYYLLVVLGSLDVTVPLASLGLFIAGVYLSSVAESYFGEKDPRKVVIDEIASFPLTMLLISPTVDRIVIAFVLNRIFDIVKPFPISKLQKLPSGWGIMLDDTAAAVCANVALRLLIPVLQI